MRHAAVRDFQSATIVAFPAPAPKADVAAGLVAELMALRRPRKLIGAARLGMAYYDRRRVLARLTGLPALPGPVLALTRLLAAEAAIETARREGRADYDLRRHLELLIAALSEGRAITLAGGILAGAED
ncbi:DUF6477 family protein [Paracoccus sp. p4-l81]|uniref:DUF6477 family protein n=1 Tax=Paracoccus sp. p4-l81 TaxID=3342806 RepID=UPI0035B71780